MKKALISIIATLLTVAAVAAYGQGSVTFQNVSTIAGWKPVADRNVKWGENDLGVQVGWNLSSNHLSTVRAQLFYGLAGSQPDQLTEVDFAPATFRGGTSATLGSWFGGSRTLPGFSSTDNVALQVRVWDSALTTNGALARSGLGSMYGGTNGGHYGESAVFSYTIPTNGSPGSLYLMNNLTSIKFEYYPYNTNPSAPIWIIRQPYPPIRTVQPGQNAQFSIRAYGEDLHYQWLLNDTNVLTGANSDVLQITNASHGQAGYYFVVISNTVGVVTSSIAQLNVQPTLGVFMLPTVQLIGEAGVNYRLEYTTAITAISNWTTLTNITLSTNIEYYFDFDGVGRKERYYRLVLP